MLRIYTICAFFMLSACDENNNVSQELVSNQQLTGTWIYNEFGSVEKSIHISGNDDAVVITRCRGKYQQKFYNENNVLISESGNEYWNIRNPDSLYRGEQEAVKIDNEAYFSFGTLSVRIGGGEPSILNTAIETSEFCAELYTSHITSYINIYAEDHANLSMLFSINNAELPGTHSIELGEFYARVTWVDRSYQGHTEWLESGTLECLITADENLECHLNATLVLSGAFVVDFIIEKKYMISQFSQATP